uniref:ALMS motif domain-containing protein n=1 Tax=Stomoxys calcitrans TaxID=35570 RepID=A0A1I8PK43_STOCA
MERRGGLPRTPRINETILEYCEKAGKGRDLEKFMRIYSPASSQGSHRTQSSNEARRGVMVGASHRTRSRDTVSSTSSSCDALSLMPVRPLNNCYGVNSKSMPNIDVHDHDLVFKDVMLDINMDVEIDNAKVHSTSSENIHTPKKQGPHEETKQAKTPDSVAKTHRRLEWDSFGDVGYRKSMSASNISVLERSLLRESLEGTVAVAISKSHKEDQFPSEQNKSINQPKQVNIVRSNTTEHATPPLACSTLVEGHSGKINNRGARPKMVSQGTSSTSLQKKFEKYAQTSLLKPATTHSQEIQVSMSTSASVVEGTATPSSFEYYSSRSSKSRSSRSSAGISSNLSNTNIPPGQHPFITSITDLLKKRKVMNEKSTEAHKQHQYDSIKKLQSRFQSALDENKENTSNTNSVTSTGTSFSLARQAPELDLGIQLICSLIDAKSVNGKQKKKLIRDIVKRLTRLTEGALDEQSNQTSTKSGESSASSKQNVYDAVYSRRRKDNKSHDVVQTCSVGVSPLQTMASYCREHQSQLTINSTGEQLENAQVYQNTCPHGCKWGKSTNNRKHEQNVLGNSNKQSTCNKQLQPPYATDTASSINNNNVPIAAPTKHNNGMQSELIAKQKTLRNALQGEHHLLKSKATQTSISTDSVKSKKSHVISSTRTISSDTTTTTTTSSTSSHDLPTQKSLRKNTISNEMEGEQPTMREWLNPLTQSEIDYEEKKREENEKKAAAEHKEALRREKNAKKSKQHSCGRDQQLDWIENEIHRLECLKNLLLHDEHDIQEEQKSANSTSGDDSSHKSKESSINCTQTDKLYDTVYSDKSSVLSESAERLVKEIEVILEESSEDMINLNENTKKSRQRKKETQLVYEKVGEEEEHPKGGNTEKMHTIKEITIIKEKQFTENNPPKSQPVQRQKIDTPITNSDHSQEGTETLRDMVKQRKQEFMASYKTRKQHHYDALKQQQKDQNLFKYLPIKQVHVQVSKEKPSVYTGYYSVPHTINRKFSPTEYAYPQSNLPPTPQEQDTSNSSVRVVYATTTANTFNQRKTTQKPSTSSAAATTSTSSNSIFCMSSDVSVPMGSNNASSTPTTTHHYDDVAAARVPPLQSSHQLQPYFYAKSLEQQKKPHTIATASAFNVRPKGGIAYVIEFDNKQLEQNIAGSTEQVLATTESAAILTTNNIECLAKSSNEPQLSLQDHLEKAKPNFLKQCKERKAILNKLQSMRQERDRQLRDIVENTSFNSLERRLRYLPPPPIQKLRILKTKEMKALTNKRVAALPEVVARKQQEIEERKRRGNRVLRDVFNLRLQKRVRSGKLSLNHSKVVI